MSTISDSLLQVKQRIAQATLQYGRSADDIQLLAVSKTRPVADIQSAMQGGQYQFGESYVQEAISKIQALREEKKLEWHFIGPIQSNKTRLIAENFAWVQSLDSLKHAQRLHDQRPDHLPPLNICIQVNVSAEPQKSGISLNQLPAFAQALTQWPRLQLRGLMAIPAYSQDFTQQRMPFQRLYEAYRQLQQAGLTLDTLSMGMTEDMEAALAEGATMVRIGTAIFGERE